MGGILCPSTGQDITTMGSIEKTVLDLLNYQTVLIFTQSVNANGE